MPTSPMPVSATKHVLFVDNNESLWGMGRKDRIGLGSGSSYAISPSKMEAGGVSDSEGGYLLSMFIKNDGSLWAIGG